VCSKASGATSTFILCLHEILTLLLRCTVIPHHAGLGAREHLVTSNVRVVATKIASEATTSALFLCFRLCHWDHRASLLCRFSTWNAIDKGHWSKRTLICEISTLWTEFETVCSKASGATSTFILCLHEILTLLLRCTVIPHHAGLGAREHLVTSNVRVVATKIPFEATTSALFLCFCLCNIHRWCLMYVDTRLQQCCWIWTWSSISGTLFIVITGHCWTHKAHKEDDTSHRDWMQICATKHRQQRYYCESPGW